MSDPFQIIEEALEDLRYSNDQPSLRKAWDAKDARNALCALREELERLERLLAKERLLHPRSDGEWSNLMLRAEKAEAENQRVRTILRQFEHIAGEPLDDVAIVALDSHSYLKHRAEKAEDERDHYRFHFDQQEQRAEKAEEERDRLRRIVDAYDSPGALGEVFAVIAGWMERAEAERDRLQSQLEFSQTTLRSIESMAGAGGSGEIPAMPIAAKAREAIIPG